MAALATCKEQPTRPSKQNEEVKGYRGFVAGVFSGVTKLAGIYIFQMLEHAHRLTSCSWPSGKHHIASYVSV